jgi:AAA family ATP:ADP antiporter
MFTGLTQLEVKAYSAFGQSLLLLAVVPVYAILASIWTRRQLIIRTGVAMSAVLVCFWLLQPEFLFDQVPYIGVLFYMFVGIFSVTLVAQFWSFASDVYGETRGKRLFPLVAIGASAGGALGAWIGQQLIEREFVAAFDLILLAIVPLGIAISLTVWTDKRGTYGHPHEWTTARWHEPAAPVNEGAYRLIARHRYLGATAVMVMLFSWIVASGDNILFGLVQESISLELAGSEVGEQEMSRLINAATTAFYSDL